MNKLCFAIAVLFVGAGCTPKPGATSIDNTPAPVVQKPERTSTKREFPLSGYAKQTIQVKGHSLNAYVADTPGEQAEGLMWLEADELGADEAMIFVFTVDEERSFWMHNTLIPLDIAYLDASGRILNIRPMRPLDESPQPSEGKARYAVETHLGWFKLKGVGIGARFDLGSL